VTERSRRSADKSARTPTRERTRFTRRQWLIGIALGPCFLSCYSPSLYQTPRTLPRGQLAVAVAIEPAAIVEAGQNGRVVVATKPLPAVLAVMRYGLAHRIETSLSYGPNSPRTGALALKLQVVRTPYVDVAILPRLTGGFVSRFNNPFGPPCDGAYCNARFVFEPSLIAMLGVNIGPTTVVVAPGVVRAIVPSVRPSYRLTIGVQWRLSKLFALHPEVTYMPEPFGIAAANGGWFGGLGIVLRGQDGYR
jgi:hypothetical protein